MSNRIFPVQGEIEKIDEEVPLPELGRKSRKKPRETGKQLVEPNPAAAAVAAGPEAIGHGKAAAERADKGQPSKQPGTDAAKRVMGQHLEQGWQPCQPRKQCTCMCRFALQSRK